MKPRGSSLAGLGLLLCTAVAAISALPACSAFVSTMPCSPSRTQPALALAGGVGLRVAAE